jgi:hypothetical protein
MYMYIYVDTDKYMAMDINMYAYYVHIVIYIIYKWIINIHVIYYTPTKKRNSLIIF